jgi:hypothetical protein
MASASGGYFRSVGSFMDLRRAFARASALAGSIVVVAAVLPAVPATAATMAITAVSPNSAINSGNQIFTLTTGNSYLPTDTLTVTLTRHGFTDAPNILITTSGVVVTGTPPLPSHTVQATLDLTALNPGKYDITVQPPTTPPDPQSREDTCSSCLTIYGLQPAVSSVSPSTVGEGTPLSVTSTNTTYVGFENFVINGQSLTKGYYEQCTLTDCSSSGPTVAVRLHGTTTSDPNVTLLDTASTSSGANAPTVGTSSQINLRMNVTGTDTTAYFDDIVVTNTDGKSATLANALHVLPRPTVDSLALASTGGTTIGRNATGQTITLTGHDFLPTSTGISFIPPSVTNPPSTISFTQPPVISGDGTTITLNGVTATGVKQATGLGTWHVVVTDPTIHAASAPQPLTVDDAPTPTTPVIYSDSTRTDGTSLPTDNTSANGQYYYGQGAQGVHFVVPVSGPLVAGTGLDGTTHTHLIFTNLPAGAHLVSETASTSPNIVTDTFNIDPGTTIGDSTFKLQNPDGGTSDSVCDNEVTNQNEITTFNKENSCDLSIDAGPTISTIAGATQPAGTVGGSLTIFGSNLHQPGNNLVHVTINNDTTTYVDQDFTATTVNGVQQVTVTGIGIDANTPEGAADITVRNNDDRGQIVCTDCFHISSVTVASVTPQGNTNDGPITVTIAGKNYNDDATFELQQIGVETLTPTSAVTVSQDPNSTNTADKIASATFDFTGAAPGYYDVIVTNPTDPHMGSATLSHAFQVLAQAPTATSVAPSALGGGATNAAVTVVGTNIFTGAHLVFSNTGITAVGDPVISPDHTTITQHVNVAQDATTGAGTVKVVNSDAQETATKAFTVDAAPVVNSITPSSHANGTSFTMTIAGSGFSTSPAPTVSFSNDHVTGSVTNVTNAGDSLTVSVQIGNDVATSAPTAVHVTVINSDSGQRQSPTDLTVNPTPTFDSTTPSAVAPGENVPQMQIFGTGFQSSATVALDPSSATGITFGTPTTISSTEIDVPVTVDPSTAGGVRTFDVTNPDTGAVAGTFTVVTAPSAPQTVTASGGAHSITVQWAAPADNGGSAITSYTVTLTKQGDPSTNASFTTADGTTHQHTFTTTNTPAAALANGTTYIAQVLASNAAGNSPAAPAGGVAATTATVPGAPTGLHVAAGDGRAYVRWSTPSNGGSPITAYLVTATSGSHSVTTSTTTNITYVSGLTNGLTYSIHVVARNAVGDGPASASGSVTPKFVTAISIATSKPSVSYGTKITVSGHLMRSNHTGVAGVYVLLYRIPDVGKTAHIATLKTSSTGGWSYTYAPPINGRYYARYLGNTGNAASTSGQVRTNVAVVIRITSPVNNSRTSASTPLVIKGSVTPNKSGATVTLYYVDSKGAVHKLAATKLTSSSTYAFSIRLGRGTWHLRVVIGNTTNNLGARTPILTASRV